MREMSLESIKEQLKEKGRVIIQEFGTFEVKIQGPRKWRSPFIDEIVDIPEKRTVVFKASKNFFD